MDPCIGRSLRCAKKNFGAVPKSIVNPAVSDAMAINHVVLTGTCADPGPTLTYNAASAKPEAKLTLIVSEGKGEQVFNLFVPVFVYGTGAERAAEEVNAGDLIAVDGRLSWKSTLKKGAARLDQGLGALGLTFLWGEGGYAREPAQA
jgi:hypothetical protein